MILSYSISYRNFQYIIPGTYKLHRRATILRRLFTCYPPYSIPSGLWHPMFFVLALVWLNWYITRYVVFLTLTRINNHVHSHKLQSLWSGSGISDAGTKSFKFQSFDVSTIDIFINLVFLGILLSGTNHTGIFC